MKQQTSSLHLPALTALGFLIASAGIAHADHGPGTSGGGVLTQSGETLKPGTFSVEFREDYTEFEHLSQSQIEAKAAAAGSIDLLDRSFISSIGLSYGVVENFRVTRAGIKFRFAGFDRLVIAKRQADLKILHHAVAHTDAVNETPVEQINAARLCRFGFDFSLREMLKLRVIFAELDGELAGLHCFA